jgi:hypothetical protein
MHRFLFLLLLLAFTVRSGIAQPNVRDMLMMNVGIQIEATDAVNAMYNFKFAEAEAKYRELKNRYPYHPMPYFLLGLSEWWKIMPTNITTERYDRSFHAYMDSSIIYADKLFKADEENFEAAFFLAAAHGFKARLYSERKNWRKATLEAEESLDYLETSRKGNALSPEFLFGEALFNYYAVWIKENYFWLRPVLLFFPDGDKKKGMEQLRTVAMNAFYTRTEAQMWLMKILANEENNGQAALPHSKYLAETFPDNSYFHRFYARMLFAEGQLTECEKVSQSILDKLALGMPGYESISGRYATYFLAYINHHRHKDLEKAKGYYTQSIDFARQTNELASGYAINARLNLARIADQQGDKAAARNYMQEVKKVAEPKSDAYKTARDYLRKKK